MLLTELDELRYHKLGAGGEVQVYDDLFKIFRVRVVFIEVDDMVLQDVHRQLPFSESPCDDKWFEFFYESLLHLLLLEHEE